MLLMFNLSQFRTDKFIRSTPPIRAAYRRLGEAAINLNKRFIRRRPTQKAMRTKKASSVIPRHHSAIWVNQIATGRRGLISKSVFCKATAKALKRALAHRTFAVAVSF